MTGSTSHQVDATVELTDPGGPPTDQSSADGQEPQGPQLPPALDHLVALSPAVLRRAVAGDDRAFATLIEHYDPMVRELAFHLLGDQQAMDDVLHTAYVKAYRALPRLTPPAEPAEPGPWIYRIVYLACLDELRRRYRHEGLTRRAPGAPLSSDGPAGAPPAEDRAVIAQALTRLPADHRAAVVLVDRAGLPVAALGVVLGLPDAGARKVLARARASLRTALDLSSPRPDVDVR